jgi:hypothetical protein
MDIGLDMDMDMDVEIDTYTSTDKILCFGFEPKLGLLRSFSWN